MCSPGIRLDAGGASIQSSMSESSDDLTAAALWTTSDWLASVGATQALASALLDMGSTATQFEQTRVLAERFASVDALSAHLQQGRACEVLAALLFPALQKLAASGSQGGGNADSKFAGAVELSYGGLDVFFGGLEGQVGAPDPKVYSAMEAEHTKKADAKLKFVTGNYGVTTSSEIEWWFVIDPTRERLARLRLEQWPAEGDSKLPERRHRRRPVPLAKVEEERDRVNERLRTIEQPEMTRFELVAGRLYTGPLFVKYNSVLRGGNGSGGKFLSSQSVSLDAECAHAAEEPPPRPAPGSTLTAPCRFVSLCCAKEQVAAYECGALSFVDARAAANRYTTTLHAINSCIVKASSLVPRLPAEALDT